MFYECSSLIELDISHFNICSLIDMSKILYGCSSLKKINIFNLNSNNIIKVDDMFFGCPDGLEKNFNN